VLPVAVASPSSDGNATPYVLPVWWMTLCFHIMLQMDLHQSWHMFHPVCQVAVPVGCQTTLFGQVRQVVELGMMSPAVSDCILFVLNSLFGWF